MRELIARLYEGTDAPWQPVAVGCHPGRLEICVATRGRAHIGLHRGSTSHGPVEYLLVGPGEEHRCWTEDAEVSLFMVHLEDDVLGELAQEARISRPSWRSGVASAPRSLWQTLEQLSREHAGAAADPVQKLALESHAIQLAVALFRIHLRAEPRAPSGGPTARGIKRVEELMRGDPTRKHSLSDLAATAGLSSYHLVRSFKRVYGKPPHAYLLELRVREAAALIERSDRSLTEIAFDLGFGSSSRLTEAFKKTYGVTPSAWRRQRDADRRSGSSFRK